MGDVVQIKKRSERKPHQNGKANLVTPELCAVELLIKGSMRRHGFKVYNFHIEYCEGKYVVGIQFDR